MRLARQETQQCDDKAPTEPQPSPVDRAQTSVPEPGATGRAAQRSTPGTMVRALIATATLAVVATLLLGITAYRAQQTISQNVSHVDRKATSDAATAVSDIVTKAFSFDYAKPEETEQVATTRLRGQALTEYQRLFAPVKQQAGTQKLVVTATVKSAGVITLREEWARVLVFADQFAVRAGTDQYSAGPAQLEVAAHRVGDTWTITEIRLL